MCIVFFGRCFHNNLAVISHFGQVVRHSRLREFNSSALCRKVSNQGCNGGRKGRTIPRAPDHWVAPKRPDNVASFFFNAVHLLRAGLRFEHGAPNLFLALGAISPRYAPVSHRGLFAKIPSLPLAPEIIFFRHYPCFMTVGKDLNKVRFEN